MRRNVWMRRGGMVFRRLGQTDMYVSLLSFGSHTDPADRVRAGAFYLGVYEITQAQWTLLMGTNPSAFQGEKFPDAKDMPVEQVSWADAQAFIRERNEEVRGGGFRLPTEAEWELCSSLDRPYPFDAADGRESAAAPALRVLRGGWFADPGDLLDPAFRHTERPDRRLEYNGLRLARDVPEPR